MSTNLLHVQPIKHRHPIEQTREKNRSIDCACLRSIAFFFSLLNWMAVFYLHKRFVDIQV